MVPWTDRIADETMTIERQTLILGVGNVLMGDEGVGVHAVNAMQEERFPRGVTLLDGGTGGFHLLSLFQEYDPIVLIDATMDERVAGTVTLTEPRFASDFPRTLSAHDIGLRDLLESATLIGPLPKLYLITVSIPSIQPMSMDLSPPVRNSLPEVIRTAHTIINRLTST
jgi:hydrogenase maturation protease